MAEDPDIYEIRCLLASEDDAEVLNGLKKLKHGFIKDIEKITPLKKLRVVTAVLHLIRRQRFANLGLSIIADACVHVDFLQEIFDNDGVELLIRLLKDSSNNEIKNRACRALGNIAKCHSGYKEILRRTPVVHILRFLSSTRNSQSHLVGLRTLRILGVNTKTQDLLAEHGGLSIISSFLDSENESVVLNSLKTLISLSGCNEFNKSVLLEYETLVVIQNLFHRSKDSIKTNILMLIKQLSYSKENNRKNNLKYAGFVQICCDIIAQENISYEMREAAVLTLCNCLDISHSWDKQNPIDLQYLVLKALTQALNANAFKVVHMSIFTSMAPLFSDDAFTDAFLELKFIDTLVNHLKIYISNNKCTHSVMNLSKLNSSCKNSCANVVKENEVEDDSLSESASSSGTSQTSSHLGHIRSGPYSRLNNISASSDSESESEPEDCDIANESDLNDRPVRESKRRHKFYVPPSSFPQPYIFRSGPIPLAYRVAKGAKKRKMNSRCQLNTSTKFSKKCCECDHKVSGNFDETILFMMLQLSHFYIKMSSSPFANPSVYSVLLDYVSSVGLPHERASLILAAILKNECNFKPLIVHGFVDEVDEKMKLLHDPHCCYRCNNIKIIHRRVIENCRAVAVNEFARRTLYSLVHSTESALKLRAIYAVSRLVVDRYALSEVLFTKDAIQVIFNSLCSESKTEQERSFNSICEMYKSANSERKQRIKELYAKKKFPKFCQSKKKPTCSFEGYKFNVEFLLDSGAKVWACREKMSEQSDYFRALLSGYFSEGNSKSIQLPNITKDALAVILHFLHGCGKRGYCPYFDKIPMKLLLELLAKCDEFLLFPMKTVIEKNLLLFVSQKTVTKIYQTGKLYNASDLCEKIIDFIFTLDTSSKKIPKIFEQLMCPEFLMDLKKFMKDHFEVRPEELQVYSFKPLIKYI